MDNWTSNRNRILQAAENAIVIWDFDGVIADTEPLHEESYRLMLERVGYTPALDFYPPFTGTSNAFVWQTFKEMGVPLDNEVDDFAQEKSGTLKK